MSSCLVTGASGQTAKSLIELLLEKGHKVYGMVRRTSTPSTARIRHLLDKIELLSGDLADEHSLISVLDKSQPDVVYNLAAQSLVPISWEVPVYTGDITGLGVVRLLSAIRKVNPKIRFLQASSSEMFGLSPPPQSEKTPFYPRSPYACAKVFAHHTTINTRESYGMFCSTAISFNHEGPDRGYEFVSKKITDAAVKIKNGQMKKLKLGNMDAKRDWGFAGDVARAMTMIMEHTEPDDFVVATGETHSVRDFVEVAFGYLGMDYKDYVEIDQSLIRPCEVPVLKGDYSKIKRVLGWEPTIRFADLVKMMMQAELDNCPKTA